MIKSRITKKGRIGSILLVAIMVLTMMPGLAFATYDSDSGSSDSSEMTPSHTYADKSFVLDLTKEAGYTGKGETVIIKIGDKVIATSSSAVPGPTVPTEGEDTSTVSRTTAAEGTGTTVTEGETTATPTAHITDNAFADLFVTNEENSTNDNYTIKVEQGTKLSVEPRKAEAVIPITDQNATHFTIEGLATDSAPTDTEVVPLMGQFKLVRDGLDGYTTDKYGIMAYKTIDSTPKMYDIIGFHGDGWKSTTYARQGYNVFLRTLKTTSDSEAEDPYDYNDPSNNLTVTPSFKFVNYGKLLKVTYTVENSDKVNAKDFALGVSADIQIGVDDSAPIEEFSDGRGFKMTEEKDRGGNPDANPAQFNFFGKTTKGVTNVTGYSFAYYGNYSTEANAFDIESHEVNGPYGSKDSGMAYSWHDQTLAASETKTYSIAIGIGGLGSEEAGGGTTEPTDPTPPVYIQDPVIPAPEPEDNQETAEVTPTIPSDGKLEDNVADAAIEQIKEDTTKSTLELDFVSPPGVYTEIPASVFEKVKNTDEIDKFIIRNNVKSSTDLPVTLEFNKKDIVDTSIPVKSGGKIIEMPELATNQLPENTKSFAFDLAHNGAFPGKCLVTVNVPTNKYQPGDEVYVYHIDSTTKMLLPVPGAPFEVGTNQQVSFELYHASEYAVTDNITDLTLNKKAVNITDGNKTRLKANASGATFKSSNPAVATVDANGVVRGKKPGSVKITATLGAKTAQSTVRVRPTVVSNVKASASYSGINVTWDKVDSPSGYVVYKALAKDGDYKVVSHIKNSKTNSFKTTTVRKGKTYYFKVKAYKLIEGKKYFSKEADIVKVKAK